MNKTWDGFLTENGKKKQLVIADAAEDSLGNIWMADLDEGIICYNRKLGTYSKPLQDKTGQRCHSNRIYCRNGYCYSVISNVLTRWSINLHDFKTWPLPFQLDKEIMDIVPDQQGRWWMATRGGLIVLNERTGSFQRFTEADGFVKRYEWHIFCRRNGEILFAAEGGLNCLLNRLNLLSATSTSPVAQLTAIEEQWQTRC